MTKFSASVLAQARLEAAKYTTGIGGNRTTHKPGPHESGVRGVGAPVLAPLSYFAHLHVTLFHSLITPPPLPASLFLTPSLPSLCCSPHLPSLLFRVPHFPFSFLLSYLISPPLPSSSPHPIFPLFSPDPPYPTSSPSPYDPTSFSFFRPHTSLHLDPHSEYQKEDR